MPDKTPETQQELFQEFSSAPKKPDRLASITKTHKPILITTTLEQILMLSILFVLLLCGIFFLGVLRGKSLRPPERAPIRRTLPATRAVLPTPSRPMTLNPPTQAQRPGTAASPAKTDSQVPVAEKPYTIQVVTHRKKEFAEAEVSRIRKLGYISFIIPSGDYFQVCAGQYASKEEARKDLGVFSSKYKDCFLRHR